MPIIINDMEIVAEPPGEGGQEPSASVESESKRPDVSPAVIRQIMEREMERAARVFAH